jgi:hypothetical protein
MSIQTAKRVRRTDEQVIADLEAKIARLKRRAVERTMRRSPAITHTLTAVKRIDAALAETDDKALRQALDEARATLMACLAVAGVVVPAGNGARVRRTAQDKAQLADVLLAHIKSHSGQRGEQIAAALGTDSKAMRPVMHTLIAENKIKTRGQRRGMQYFAA